MDQRVNSPSSGLKKQRDGWLNNKSGLINPTEATSLLRIQKFSREPTKLTTAGIYKQLLAAGGGGGRVCAASGKPPRGEANRAAKAEEVRCSGAAAALLMTLEAEEDAAAAGLEATRSQEGHMERVVAGRCM